VPKVVTTYTSDVDCRRGTFSRNIHKFQAIRSEVNCYGVINMYILSHHMDIMKSALDASQELLQLSNLYPHIIVFMA
jgi:hypothetical protein